MCTLEPRIQDQSSFQNGFRLDCVFILSKKTLNSVLLEYWNSQKSLSTIRQCVSCLLNEGITYKNMQKYFFKSSSSIRHEKHCQILERLFWLFQYSRNTQSCTNTENILFLIAFYGFCLWSLFDFSNCRIDIFGYNISTV